MVNGSEQSNYESQGESVSALVDGEQNDFDLRRVLRDIDDEQVREKWRRYHLIGASLRGELNRENTIDISVAISAALEGEPAYQAAGSSRVKVLLNGLGKTAIAAGVMVAVLVGVQYAPIGNDSSSTTVANAEVDNVEPMQNAEVIPAGFEAPRLNARVVSTNPSSHGAMTSYRKSPFVIPVPEASRPASDPELQAYLNRLLLKHAEQSSQSGVISVLPYARVLYPEQEK